MVDVYELAARLFVARYPDMTVIQDECGWRGEASAAIEAAACFVHACKLADEDRRDGKMPLLQLAVVR